jgi:hypothetical protein
VISLSPEQVTNLARVMGSCRDSVLVPGLALDVLRLDNVNQINILRNPEHSGEAALELDCGEDGVYWQVLGGDGSPLRLLVTSDPYTSYLSGYSITSFYVSIILLIANYIRTLFQGGIDRVVLSDMPRPDPLLRLCQGVRAARLEDDQKAEESLFWQLIDVVRSPEEVKKVAGSWLQERN